MFWDGFYKQAAAAMKGIRSGMGLTANSAKMAVGAKPQAGVATAAAFKPNKIPSPSTHAAPSKNLTPSLVKSLGDTIPRMPSASGRGVGEVTI